MSIHCIPIYVLYLVAYKCTYSHMCMHVDNTVYILCICTVRT